MTDGAATSEPGEGVYFMPRCEISRRWGGDLDALLCDSAFRTHDECKSWALRSLSTLWLYGVYFKDVYRFDENSSAPFNAIMGDMLGIGRIAVIGGREWEREFAEAAGDTALAVSSRKLIALLDEPHIANAVNEKGGGRFS